MHSYQATIVTTFCFFLSTIASPATSRTGPIVQRHGMWNHLGCFVDSAQRILPVQQDTCGKNTVEYCLDLCAQQGFPLAGVEYGDECYCGKDWNTFNTVCPNNCNMTCTANSQEICGGVYAINVYERAQLVEKCGEWTAVGCAEEPKWREGERRNLPYHPGTDIPIKDMTVEKCLDGCAKSGYTCAGLEYGQECWCGNCTANDFKYGSYDKCYMGCTGDPRELCGSGEAEGWEIVYTRNVGTSGGSGSGSSGGGGSGGGSGGGGSEGSGHGTVGSWTPCGCYQLVFSKKFFLLPDLTGNITGNRSCKSQIVFLYPSHVSFSLVAYSTCSSL
ncbi:hypothetical protein E1B28_003820 [Marasmius oreades]|uniref:WSC domain-containing protein n=1 Tax=Marasmius oreades TaxID=181124 RepID=A0A9P7UXD0_9AGAR|nr:uncharacterized protein E1B28_003820 [Marasmius oreades]KAG7096376.1 hypothetical protein E1B28_003820 [Marasmius oreades]